MSAIDKLLEEIRRDNRSGAAELTRKAAEAFSMLISAEAEDAAALRDELGRLARELISAQPSMAPIINLANRICLAAQSSRVESTVRRQLKATLIGQVRSAERIARRFYSLVNDGCRLLTYSYSSTVLHALIYAHERGKRFYVVCSEGRPVCEGVTMAERLAGAGISVTLVTDAALFGFVPGADMVVIGADCVSASGIVNKVGTYPLALLARSNRVPVYCLASEDKLLAPKLYALFKNAPKDYREILSRKPKNVQILNYYFESTPLRFVSAVITERGKLKAADVLRRTKTATVAPQLRTLASKPG